MWVDEDKLRQLDLLAVRRGVPRAQLVREAVGLVLSYHGMASARGCLECCEFPCVCKKGQVT